MGTSFVVPGAHEDYFTNSDFYPNSSHYASSKFYLSMILCLVSNVFYSVSRSSTNIHNSSHFLLFLLTFFLLLSALPVSFLFLNIQFLHILSFFHFHFFIFSTELILRLELCQSETQPYNSNTMYIFTRKSANTHYHQCLP